MIEQRKLAEQRENLLQKFREIFCLSKYDRSGDSQRNFLALEFDSLSIKLLFLFINLKRKENIMTRARVFNKFVDFIDMLQFKRIISISTYNKLETIAFKTTCFFSKKGE